MREVKNCITGEIEILEDAPPSGVDPTPEELLEAEAEAQMKALALVMLDEINILRNAAGLQPRTVNQLKQAVKNRL